MAKNPFKTGDAEDVISNQTTDNETTNNTQSVDSTTETNEQTSLESEMDALLNQTQTMNAVTDSTTNSVIEKPSSTEQTNLFDGNAKKTKTEKPKVNWTGATGVVVNTLITEQQNAMAQASGDALSVAKRKFGESTRIVAYITKTDAKIDFKKILSPKPQGNDTVREYSFALDYYAPAKPDRVVVKYPLNLYSEIKNAVNKGQTLHTTEIANATNADTNGDHTTNGVVILSIKKTNHDLYNWIGSYCPGQYIQEAEEIFEPYTKTDKSGIGKTFSNYDDASNYSLTGGRPGVFADINFKNKGKSAKNAGVDIKLDILSKDNHELKVTYKNTGRQRFITPHNYIADKYWDTIDGKPAPDNATAVKLSLAYFSRFFENYTTLKVPKPKEGSDDTEYTYIPSPNSPIKISGSTADTFLADCFAPGSTFWNNLDIRHWYETATETITSEANGATTQSTIVTRRKLRPEEIKLIKREESVSKTDPSKVTYKNVFFPIQDNTAVGNKYAWSNVIPDAVKKALGTAVNEFTFDMYLAKRDQKDQSSSKKASGNININMFMPGKTFDEIKAIVEKTLASAGGSVNL